MHFNTLERLRQQMYHCFERSRDGLFNLSDALLSEPQARSLPELSLSVFFQRRWPSVYAAFVQTCQQLGVGALIRLKGNRKLYRPAPPRQQKQRGPSCKHGPLFQGTRPETYGPADAQWQRVDEHGKRVLVSCWKHLHFREAPQTEVSVIRVLREAARDTKRDPRESWFVWTGNEDIPLELVRA